jgi:MFS family permease
VPTLVLRRARAANTVIFAATGAVYGAWSTRIPAIGERLELSNGELAVAVLGLEAGAVTGLPAGGALVARAGSPRALQVGFALLPAALLAVALAPTLVALTIALAVMAAATSVIDVAMNAQGVELERRYGRPLLSSMHAGHPFGLVLGGAAGTAAAAAGVSVPVHFAAAAVAGWVAGLGATRWLVREEAPPSGRTLARPSRRLALLGLVAFCAFLLDGAAYNWSATYAERERGAAPGLAAAAFTAFALALALGRLAGDRLVERLGRVRLVQAGGAVAGLGAVLVVVAPGLGLSIAGWATFGLGLATVAPTVLGAAPAVAVAPARASPRPRAQRSAPAPVAIAAVTTIGYLGSFSGPAAVGALAEAASLSTALWLLAAVCALMIALAPAGLRRPEGRSTAPEPTVTK